MVVCGGLWWCFGCQISCWFVRFFEFPKICVGQEVVTGQVGDVEMRD